MKYENLSMIVGGATKIARGNHKIGTHHVLLTFAKHHEALEEEFRIYNYEPVECLLKDNELRYVYTMQLIGQEAWRQTKEYYQETEGAFK